MKGIGGKGEEEWVGDLREKVFGMKENKKAGERKESRKRGKQRAETRREFSSDMDVEGSTYKNFTHYNTIFCFFVFLFLSFLFLLQYISLFNLILAKTISSLCLNRFGGVMCSCPCFYLGHPYSYRQ